jgi:hypothetical protein
MLSETPESLAAADVTFTSRRAVYSIAVTPLPDITVLIAVLLWQLQLTVGV